MMRQPSLFEVLNINAPRNGAESTGGQLEVYDFFASAGGFSTGAEQAGARVVYACDMCPKALETHRRNHRHTKHHCVMLPNDEAVERLPSDGRRFHVHCSPPCVKLSSINRVNAFEKQSGVEQKGQAVDLVEWSLKMMLESRCTSWSFEQVASAEVVAAVKRAARAHPGRVAWSRVDLSLLGVPQIRTRLIAGTPRLVSRLQRLCTRSRRRSVRAVLPSPRGTHVHQGCSYTRKRRRLNRKKGETKYVTTRAAWSDNCRSVDLPAHTVRGRHAPTWVTIRNGKAVDHSVFLPREMAILQTFPHDYKLPTRKFDAYLHVGNAVPPLVAKLLLEEEARVA